MTHAGALSDHINASSPSQATNERETHLSVLTFPFLTMTQQTSMFNGHFTLK